MSSGGQNRPQLKGRGLRTLKGLSKTGLEERHCISEGVLQNPQALEARNSSNKIKEQPGMFDNASVIGVSVAFS